MNITHITWHNTAGDDGYVTTTIEAFEDDLYACAQQTVDDCEQEINEGGYWADDDEGDRARTDAQDELYENLIGQARKCYTDGSGVIECAPWYAKAQGMTFKIIVQGVTAA